MNKLREAAQQALKALELWKVDFPSSWAKHDEKAIKDLKDALRESVQQGCNHCNQPLYAAIKCKVCGRVTKSERNFCPRCGKRTRDIHTCTPPGDCDVHG